MKRRSRRIKGTPGLKQHQSCSKTITVAIVTMSANIAIGRMKHEELDNNSQKRFKEIQRKYGFQLFMECAPEVIERMTAVPRITMNLGGKQQKVFLQAEYLEKYYNKLKGE